MSEESTIEQMIVYAKHLMLNNTTVMVDGSLRAAGIFEVVHSTVSTACPYDYTSQLRDYPLWTGRLIQLGDRIGRNAPHWMENVFVGSANPYDCFASLVRGLTASVLEDELLLDPWLLGLDNDRDANRVQIVNDAKAEADQAAAKALERSIRAAMPTAGLPLPTLVDIER